MKIKREIIDRIVQHARQEAPVEACGYLAEKNEIVVKSFELTNVDKAREHFSFDPKEQFEVLRQAREEGCDISAVYHSHPITPARPSQEDIELAYDPNLSYVIVSLAEKKPDIQSFRIKNKEVKREKMEIVK